MEWAVFLHLYRKELIYFALMDLDKWEKNLILKATWLVLHKNAQNIFSHMMCVHHFWWNHMFSWGQSRLNKWVLMHIILKYCKVVNISPGFVFLVEPFHLSGTFYERKIHLVLEFSQILNQYIIVKFLI